MKEYIMIKYSKFIGIILGILISMVIIFVTDKIYDARVYFKYKKYFKNKEVTSCTNETFGYKITFSDGSELHFTDIITIITIGRIFHLNFPILF